MQPSGTEFNTTIDEKSTRTQWRTQTGATQLFDGGTNARTPVRVQWMRACWQFSESTLWASTQSGRSDKKANSYSLLVGVACVCVREAARLWAAACCSCCQKQQQRLFVRIATEPYHIMLIIIIAVICYTSTSTSISCIQSHRVLVE